MNPPMLDFSGKTFVVSGAGSGIGLATVTLALQLGARVVAWDLRGMSELAARLGGAVIPVDCDVTDRAAVDAKAAEIGDVFAVVTCAGICPLDDWSEPDFDAVFDRTQAINVKGSLNLARAFLPGMERRQEGRIVMLGSVSGRTASVSSVHYATSKGAIHSAVRWLARRAAQSNILVNAIAPGPIATPMVAGREATLAGHIPLGRVGRPEEIAWPILFLCSPMASFVTGSIMDVNGGIFIG